MSESTSRETPKSELVERARQMYLDSVTDEVSKICSHLNVANKYTAEQQAKTLLENCTGEQISGKSPQGLAAGAVYLASFRIGEEVTQREVAEAAGVTKVTVSKRYHSLLDVAHFSVR